VSETACSSQAAPPDEAIKSESSNVKPFCTPLARQLTNPSSAPYQTTPWIGRLLVVLDPLGRTLAPLHRQRQARLQAARAAALVNFERDGTPIDRSERVDALNPTAANHYRIAIASADIHTTCQALIVCTYLFTGLLWH
jgi:MoxR-like ATPase